MQEKCSLAGNDSVVDGRRVPKFSLANFFGAGYLGSLLDEAWGQRSGSNMVNNNRWFLLVVSAAAFGAGCGVVDTIKARALAREGNELYRQFDYRGAIARYQEALGLDKEIPNVYLNLGYSYFSIYDPSSEATGDRAAAKSAVEAFDEHLKRVPVDETARNFQIKTLIKAAPNDKDLADRAYRSFLDMLEKDPSDREARQYLVTLFIDCKRYDDAVKLFEKDLQKKPADLETMKILAIIADKSDRTQEAVDWYWRRAEVTLEPEKKAVLFYEVGTYAWNLLHFSPDRATGTAAIKLLDQGIEASKNAIALKEKYAEAMVYTNLLYLKRTLFETEDQGKYWDQGLAFQFRSDAGKILGERKKGQEGAQPGTGEGTGAPTCDDQGSSPPAK